MVLTTGRSQSLYWPEGATAARPVSAPTHEIIKGEADPMGNHRRSQGLFLSYTLLRLSLKDWVLGSEIRSYLLSTHPLWSVIVVFRLSKHCRKRQSIREIQIRL